jgi:hypothetical protein
MRRLLLLVGLVGIALGLGAGAAAAKTDFSGTWVMDASRSEGVPPEMEQTMTVKQAGDTLDVETKVVTDQGDQTLAATYVLDGKEAPYTTKRMNAEGKGKRTAKWTADGAGLEIAEEETFDSPNGEVTLHFSRKWAMLADGKTLTIELEVNGPNGPQHSKRTFVKR